MKKTFSFLWSRNRFLNENYTLKISVSIHKKVNTFVFKFLSDLSECLLQRHLSKVWYVTGFNRRDQIDWQRTCIFDWHHGKNEFLLFFSGCFLLFVCECFLPILLHINVQFQIMYNTACTFLLNIFMLYSVFRYMFLPSDFYKQQSLLHSAWQLTFLCAVLAVTYNATRLTREVWLMINIF